MVDESWAISSEGEGRYNPGVLLGSGLMLYAAWVVGTILGSVFGDVLGDPSTIGLDAAFPALFLALVAPQLRGSKARTEAADARLSCGDRRRSRRPRSARASRSR